MSGPESDTACFTATGFNRNKKGTLLSVSNRIFGSLNAAKT
jgi:hypothetical protein